MPDPQSQSGANSTSAPIPDPTAQPDPAAPRGDHTTDPILCLRRARRRKTNDIRAHAQAARVEGPATFLDVERFPSMHFQSTLFSRSSADQLVVIGELTMHGVSRSIELPVTEMSRPVRDPWGNLRLAASATAKLNRKEFGLTWNTVLEAGGFLVGDEIFIDIDIEFLEAAS